MNADTVDHVSTEEFLSIMGSRHFSEPPDHTGIRFDYHDDRMETQLRDFVTNDQGE